MSNVSNNASLKDLLVKKGRTVKSTERTDFYCGKSLPIAYRPLLCQKYGLPETCTDTAIFDAILLDCLKDEIA